MGEYNHIQRQITKAEAQQATIDRAQQDELVKVLRALVTRIQLEIKSGKVERHFASQCVADAQAILDGIGNPA